MPEETVDTPVENAPPEDDYAAYEAWAEKQDLQPGNVEAAEDAIEEEDGSETPAAEQAEPEVESAAESETAETQEQEEETEEEEEPEEPKGKGVQKRISKLTKEIRELKARLADKPEPEAEPEPAAPKPAEKQDGKPIAPKLADFESYELYEAAHAEFVEKLTDWKAEEKETARKTEDQKQEFERAKAEHEAKWSEAAAKVAADYNDVVGNEDVKISAAMESVLKSTYSPEEGTALSYYLGKHPEESLRIAQLTLADNEPQWRAALARAARELAKLESKLEAPKGKPAPAPKKETPKVTAAPKPPAKIQGRSTPAFDVHDDTSAQDYEAWERARNKQLHRK